MSGSSRIVAAITLVGLMAAACGSTPPEVPVSHVSLRLTDSTTGFGLRLADQLLVAPDAGNVFISPLSATLMLSMAASAARGDTQAAMLKMLGLDPTVDPSAEAKQTIERLAQSDANVQLELAQAAWVQNGLVLDPAYSARLRNDYEAQISNLDFRSPSAPDVVNRWVDDATHHRITQLVDSFDPSIVGYLVNATYFHALWRVEFDSASPEDFRTFTGTTVKVPTMRRSDNVTLLTTVDYQAALLPYKGGRFSALVLLPRRDLKPSDFATFLSLQRWQQALSYLHKASGSSLGGSCKEPDTAIAPDAGVTCDGTLVMPKFTLEYKKDLTDILVALGMPRDAGLPDFCAACFLSYVVQKTYLQVDEKGTTAAAATGGAVATALRVPMVVDHPFAFALIDNATDAPLFLGAIGNL
jgi:serine protease inhibitor